ncbi:DEAD/DEAH box helicase family protein [Kingella potus]|uniref:restriction endonuclease n=1 Tax=Kingella potus TaxID=265175 RepID=UPI001FD25346|nr:DEAD/DEAH box helicase family protein [Kingella potus]UOP00804.1 DEAD/DEAH box helicase family protein [Kingella potus]
MQLKFEQLDYQTDAVNAVLRLFEGQADRREPFGLESAGAERFVGNTLDLSDEQIGENLNNVQKTFGQPETDIGTHGLNFSVEMETGTGKTYVYLRTVFELNRQYGWKKFVIVVPGVAIREGVMQTIRATKTHFAEMFGKPVMHFSEYDSKRLGGLRNFAANDGIEIMVINIQSFEKDGNVINQTNESGDAPIEFIRQTRPIVIADEPQNMETEGRLAALDSLNPLFVLRYSATHKNSRHKVYSLNPVEAYNQRLVKQIVVQSVLAEKDGNGAFVELVQMQAGKGSLKARLNIHFRTQKETRKKTVTVQSGDDLFDKSGGVEAYRHGYIVNGLDAEDGLVEFSNGLQISRADNRDALQDEVMKAQIRCTIEEHLKREKKLKPQGIKVLSLFFIDKVEHYRTAIRGAGKFALWFDEIYRELAKENPDGVHNGYFSQDGKGRLKDTKGDTQADNDTYHLIMRDKETLLSFDSPLRFIFSHSALKEGWDNPNVFQICTLNETRSPLKKRQEIGRGLRLAVNQHGERVRDEGVNVLTVVPNESYESFAANLQQEYEDECGIRFAASNIKNGADRKTQTFRKNFPLDPEFQAIWQKLDRKPRYRVQYGTAELVRQAAEAVSGLPEIHAPKIQTRKAKIEQTLTYGIEAVETASGSLKTAMAFAIPDILGEIQKKTGLTRRTVFDILKASKRLDDAAANPQRFIDLAAEKINRCLHALMSGGIAYELADNEQYRQELMRNLQKLEAEGEEFYFDEKTTFRVQNAQKTIAENYIPLDSETEKTFAQNCENYENVLLYFKLPRWFKIPTPLGSYNPDWAVVKQNGEKAYFVAETKNTRGKSLQCGVDRSLLRESERLKIECAERFFEQIPEVRYQDVTALAELEE